LGPALQGNVSGRLKTRAKSTRWIDRKVSNRVTGTHGKHVPIALDQPGKTRGGSLPFDAVIERYLAQELPERNSTASSYRYWFKNYIKPKWAECSLDQIKPFPVENRSARIEQFAVN